jgi:3',5'-cyclic AMP phosphodiesterase CpdA
LSVVIVIAHISDLHLDGEDRAAERTDRVIRFLAGLANPVDAVVVTGDIADHGRTDEYEQARKLIDLPVPAFPCPGNHDVRAPYRQLLLGETGGDSPINRVHRAAGVVFAMCDSSIPGRDDGYLADETIAWLDTVLAEEDPDQPAFVCFHHPPVPIGIAPVDRIRQFGAERLAEVVERHPRVVGLLCGHAHTPAATTFAGRPLLVAPGVASTGILTPWEAGSPLDFTSPPAIAFHLLDDDRRLTTHYRVIV